MWRRDARACRCVVTAAMANGHGICHGGFIFALANSAMAFACKSARRAGGGAALPRSPSCGPASVGETLVAEAVERMRAGRSGMYDVRVCGATGELVAEFRGHTRTIRRQVFRGGIGDGAGRLDAIETASRDEIAALQRERLAWTLRHAYTNVPHYRAAFDRAGVHPDDFRQLWKTSRKFPFTTKQDLRANYPFGMFAVPREKLVRVHASSGTTGKPTVVGYTAKDIETWAHVVARSIYAAGGRPGMIVHVAYGYGLFTGGLGAHYGAERLGCTVVPVSGGMTERQVQLITDFRPDVIMVTPSYMLAILDEFRRQGLDPRDCSLKIGIFGAEPWTNAMRREIEDGFAMDAVDIYGLSEVMGPGVANECVETKDGLHIWEDHFYPEVIDPETGAVLPDGERGELVFTSLTKEGMPVVRYRTRDLTRLLPGTARTHAADGEGHRPLRRHGDRARRQHVPDAGGGAVAEERGADRPLSDRADARGPHGRGGGARGGAAGVSSIRCCWRRRRRWWWRGSRTRSG